MSFDYWQYYDDTFDWDDSGHRYRPDLKRSREIFQENGFSEKEALSYVNSGYVCFERFGVIIDRYYGGLLSSCDLRCRFPSHNFNALPTTPQSQVRVYKAKSIDDVRNIVKEQKKSSSQNLLFRGQTQNHTVKRAISNPFFTVPELGEISLIPSLWRRMLSINASSFLDFTDLSLLEWSHVLYSKFDMEDIKRRHKKLLDDGEWVHTMSEMDDCSDPVLREFGKYRLDLACHKENIIASMLATMLQHYGLYSPVLDLTESLDIALFFATYKFDRSNGKCTYKFVGTNGCKSILYLLREHKVEMERHSDADIMISDLDPLRPKRQECIVAKSSSHALNLPADFLEGVIILDFKLDKPVNGPSTNFLFPDHNEDMFLRALKKSPYARKHLTEFGNS